MLEFIQNEARDNQGAGDETRLADVGDAPVDDGAGIKENLRRGFNLIG